MTAELQLFDETGPQIVAVMTEAEAIAAEREIISLLAVYSISEFMSWANRRLRPH